MKKLAATTIGLGALLCATQAHAESSSADFSPELTTQVAEFPWESGFVPSDDAAVRLNLQATARQNVVIDMNGEGRYDWDAKELVFRGQDGAGVLASEVDIDLTATLVIDLFGLPIEADIGIWNLNRVVQGTFTPYGLPGNVDAPVVVADQIGPFNIINEPFTIGEDGTGTFVVDWVIDVPGVEFEGTAIEVSADEGSANSLLATATTENEVLPMALDNAEPGSTASMYATEYGLLTSELAIRLEPTLTLNFNGLNFVIGPLDIELAYPLIEDEEIVFDAIQMDMDVPEAPEPDPEPDPDPEPEPDPDPEPDPEPEPEDDDMGDTDGEMPDTDGDSAGFGGAESDAGCGCTTGEDNAPAGLFTLLMGLGLLGARRRRWV